MLFPLVVIRSNEMKTLASGKNVAHSHTYILTRVHKPQCQFYLLQLEASMMEILNWIIYKPTKLQ